MSAALAAIGVQGYWLFNQFRYEMCTYADEIAGEVFHAGQEEFRIRKEEAEMTKGTYIIERQSKYQSGDSVLNGLKNSFGFQLYPKDTTKIHSFRLHLDPNMPEDSLLVGVDRSVVEFFVPFSAERLDSILSAGLPGLDYRVRPFVASDTLSGQSSALWFPLSKNLFSTSISICYVFAPIERMAVWVDVDLPINPLLGRMGWQLFLSIFLILLLLACLGFQIRTIWEQMRLNELREGFVHTMIHELRRPVQTLKVFVSFLNDREMRMDEATTERVLQDSMFELDNLSAYLGKLKDMVCADERETLLRPSAFNLRELVEKVAWKTGGSDLRTLGFQSGYLVEKVVRLTNIPAGKKVSFSTAFPPDMPDLTADPVHVANVLSNLIENAIKYSGEEVNIDIVVLWNQQGVELTVSDNGFGIAPDERRKVFEKFYRSSHLPDKQIPGIGLGLSYVRQIVEAHHGSVSLRSELGEGTRITINLPTTAL